MCTYPRVDPDFAVVLDIVVIERAIELKEILDWIDVPAPSDIPDREAMTRSGLKRWRLPDTEIKIALIEDGPRAGEYLISAETIDRLPEFYERVKALPYKPGPAKQLDDTFHTMSSDQSSTIYDAFLNSPIGLDRIIPTRWMLRLPEWAKAKIAEISAWKWLGLAFGLPLWALVVFTVYRLGCCHANRREDNSGPSWRSLTD